MKHEPGSFLSHAKPACNLIGTDSVLATHDQPQRREPLLKGNRRVLKDRSHLERELSARMLAVTLPAACVNHVRNMVGVADWTPDNTIGPSGLDHELAAVLVVREKLDRIQERFGCIIIVSHGYHSTLNVVVCQVLYLLIFQ